MFSWFRRKRKAVPSGPPADGPNPGTDVKVRIAISRGDRSRTEEIDIITLAARVLGQHGRAVIAHDT
jgi:hypothetical protein